MVLTPEMKDFREVDVDVVTFLVVDGVFTFFVVAIDRRRRRGLRVDPRAKSIA